MHVLFYTALWGLVSGLLSGLFGIGGSIITTPALRLAIGTSAEIALGTPLPVIFPTTVVAGYSFYRAGFVDFKAVRSAAPAGIAGSIAGSLVTGIVNAQHIMILTAVMMIAVATGFFRDRDLVAHKNYSMARALLVGLAAGLFSGFFGVGGGIILIPGFVMFMNMPVKSAMGSSLVVIALMAVPGSIIHYLLGHIDIPLCLALSVGVIPGSRMGARFSVKARDRHISRAFGLFLMLVGLFFIYYELKELSIIH